MNANRLQIKKVIYLGLAALVYGPNTLKTKVKGKQVVKEEKTNYPFEDDNRFQISLEGTMAFSIDFRIPSWSTAHTITVNGEAIPFDTNQRIVRVDREWKDGDQVRLHFPMTLKASEWAENSRAVERGPLDDDFIWNLEHNSIEIKIPAKRIPDWKAINGLAYLPVTGREGFYKGEVSNKLDTISLVPSDLQNCGSWRFPWYANIF